MPSHPYVTVDVFTHDRFGGNPLAVVLDGRGISDRRMQQLAAEFNYSETTFVLPPDDPAHTAKVRIFNRTYEMPFAGHPNVGTGFVLGQLRDGVGDRLVFEERAGLVTVTLVRDADGRVSGASIDAPQPLSTGLPLAAETVAACLGLAVSDVRTAVHPPMVGSVGMPFLLAELEPAALGRAAPQIEVWQRTARSWNGLDGQLEVFLYAHDGPGKVRARMFAPDSGTWEDPATGSASAALVALLLSRSDAPSLAIDITQGVEMGRTSRIAARAWRSADGVRSAVAGGAVMVFRGEILL